MAESVLVPSAPPAPERRKFNPRLVIVFAVIAFAGYWGWRYFTPQQNTNVLRLSGRIEADETDIGAKTGGRITKVLVQEGETVKAGQTVVEMVDEEVNQALQAATAQVSSAQQEVAQARLELEVADSSIRAAEANLTQAREDSRGRISQAESTVAAASAQVAQAKAQVVQAQAEVKGARSQLKLAKVNRDRYADLVAQGAISHQQFDQAQTNSDTAQATLETAQATLMARLAAVKAAEKQFLATQGGLTQTQSTLMNTEVRYSQLFSSQQQKHQASSRLIGAQAKVRNAIANQQQIQKRLDSFVIKSPIDGTVQSCPLEPGAVVATGKTLLTVLNPHAIYMRVYVPEGDLGHIYVGKSARVFLDSNPQQSLPAKVRSIDPEASFTPENIYFQKDRVRQVFGVKLAIAQDQIYAKPGMPADAELDLK